MSLPPLDVSGPIDATPLIFVHGAALNRKMWLPYVERFRSRWRVVAPDLPGHGGRAAERFRLAAGSETVGRAIDLAGGRPAVLVGDSLGAYVSIHFAAAHPDRVIGLVLGGCTVNFTGWVPIAARSVGWLGLAISAIVGEERFVAKALPRLKQRFPEAPLDAIAEGGMVMKSRDVAIGELTGIDFRALLASVRAPTVLVNGEKDRLARRSEGAFQQAVPGSRLVVVPGIGHGVSLLRPRIFGDAIETLVASLR